jgi:hypothetical protein
MMSERFEDPAEAALTAFVISWPTLAVRDGELLERGDQMLRADLDGWKRCRGNVSCGRDDPADPLSGPCSRDDEVP